MGSIKKKSLLTFDGGIQTSLRDSNPETSIGAQFIKHFDIYSDPKKLVPMPSWEEFTTESEKQYGIRAIGGLSDTVYGIGKAITNWYGSEWAYRVKVTANPAKLLDGNIPVAIDLANMPANFWSHVRSDGGDVRITSSGGDTIPCEVENFDATAHTGQLWLNGSQIQTSPASEAVTKYIDVDGQVNGIAIDGAGSSIYAYSFLLTGASQTVNRVSFGAQRVGTPANLLVELYTNNAGVPGSFIRSLGSVPATSITTGVTTINLDFSSISLPQGDFFTVFSYASPNSSVYYIISYDASTGSGYNLLNKTTAYTPGTAGTGWNTFDATATPDIEFSNVVTTAAVSDYVYVYYGNPNEIAVPNGIPGFEYWNQPTHAWEGSSMRFAYNFADEDTINDTTASERFTTDPEFVTGILGQAIYTPSSFQTDSDDEVDLSGNDISVSLTFKPSAYPASNLKILGNNNGTWSIEIDTTGHIRWTVHGVSGTTTKTSTGTLTLGQWNVIDCVFDSNYYIAINGTKETFSDNDGNYDDITTNSTIQVDTGGIGYIGNIWGFDDDLSTAKITTKYNYLTANSTFWTMGSEETYSSIIPNFDGVQVWQKSISSGGNWEEYTQAGQPVKSLDHYPVNGFVETNGSDLYFIVSQQPDDAGFLFLAKTDGIDGFVPEHLLLSVLSPSVKMRPTSDSPVDKSTYFDYGSSALGSVGDPGSTNAFSAYSNIISFTPWRNYLAIGSSRRTRANVEIWNLTDANPLEFIDAGTGNLRIVGNASDILFAVVDNYIDDAVLSAGNPTMEVRQYVGNGRMDSAVRINIPTTYTGWEDDWERAVSFFKTRRNTETLFYAKLPANEDATEFNQGLWAVGKNKADKLALSLMIDTSDFDAPENIYGFAQQVFYVEKDGGIQRLNTSNVYSQTSLYKTRIMNEGYTQVSKRFKGIEIVTEPLEEDQVISVYYKRSGATQRTQILEMTGEGEIAMEKLTDIDDNNLDEYQEVEFDIESVGGKSAILEFNYKYEYTTDII